MKQVLGRIYTGYDFLKVCSPHCVLAMWAAEGGDKLGILKKTSWTEKVVERAHKAY